VEDDPRNYTAKTPGKAFYLGWTGAVAAAFIATAGLVLAREFWIGREAAEREAEQDRGPRVLVQPVQHASTARELRLPAEIHGFDETPVYAKVSGYLKTIRVDKGDRVEQGDVLAILESPELDHEVANARANYEIKALTDRRNRALLRRGVISQQQADQSSADMQQAKASFDSLTAMQAYEVIRAPFSGIITARYVDQGALIPQATTPSSASSPIVAMATLSPLRVYAQLPQSAAPFVKNGDQASIALAEYPGREFKGAVTRHPDALASATRTMLVEVDLDNRDLALLPGMYAQIAVRVAMPAGAPTVPDDALVFRDGKVYVPIVRGGRLHLSEVSLGYDDGQTVQITRGLGGDEMVAMNVGQSAREGEPVQPVRTSELEQ
jgi:membrane fusion protein, multidrug efflux system